MRLKPFILAILMAAPAAGQNVSAPQIGLSGNVGAIGFPILNSGTFQMPSDANVTFSISNVNTSAVSLKVTSAVTLTATRNIIFPAGRFLLNVENATTGTQAIQIIGISGTGVTIPNGITTAVWNDGTNFVQIGQGGFVSLTQTGIQTMAGPLSLPILTASSSLNSSGTLSVVGASSLSGTIIGGSGLAASNITDGSLATGASAICPNGVGGLFTTTGCSVSVLAGNGVSNITVSLGTGTLAAGACSTVAGSAVSGTTAASVVNASLFATAATFTAAPPQGVNISVGLTSDTHVPEGYVCNNGPSTWTYTGFSVNIQVH